MAVSVLQCLLDRRAEADRAGEIGPFERMRVRRVETGRPLHRGFQMVEAALLDERGKLGAEAAGAGRLVDDYAATGLLYRCFDGLDVDRDDGAQVDDLGVDALGLDGGEG